MYFALLRSQKTFLVFFSQRGSLLEQLEEQQIAAKLDIFLNCAKGIISSFVKIYRIIMPRLTVKAFLGCCIDISGEFPLPQPPFFSPYTVYRTRRRGLKGQYS